MELERLNNLRSQNCPPPCLSTDFRPLLGRAVSGNPEMIRLREKEMDVAVNEEGRKKNETGDSGDNKFCSQRR